MINYTKKSIHLDFQKGTSLIEILIAMAIISVLGLGIISLQYIINKNQLLVINSYKSVDEANISVSHFAREIRAARNSDNGAYVLEKINDQEIVFYSDIDYDGQTEKVRYGLEGNDLIKGVIKPVGYPVQYPAEDEVVTTLTSNVRNGTDPIFYYYNSGWPEDAVNNPLPQDLRLSDTRSVRIYLIVNTQRNDPQADYTLESTAQIRMLKDNL
jgi:prepilin-type N-terminal cleavage/methylation domain-containing protein